MSVPCHFFNTNFPVSLGSVHTGDFQRDEIPDAVENLAVCSSINAAYAVVWQHPVGVKQASLAQPKPGEAEPERGTPPLGCAGNFE
jgi:hypothetical protein